MNNLSDNEKKNNLEKGSHNEKEAHQEMNLECNDQRIERIGYLHTY